MSDTETGSSTHDTSSESDVSADNNVLRVHGRSRTFQQFINTLEEHYAETIAAVKCGTGPIWDLADLSQHLDKPVPEAIRDLFAPCNLFCVPTFVGDSLAFEVYDTNMVTIVNGVTLWGADPYAVLYHQPGLRILRRLNRAKTKGRRKRNAFIATVLQPIEE